MGEITALLSEVKAGKPGARDALFSGIYGELHKLARSKLAGEAELTLIDSSSLVHEFYLRLQRVEGLPSENRAMFFGYAANVMRSVIVDYVRSRQAAKRGGGVAVVTLRTGVQGHEFRDPDLEKLDDAMTALQQVDERCARIVEMRYFAGMTEEEIAVALDLSVRTVKRDWRKARAWLATAMRN